MSKPIMFLVGLLLMVFFYYIFQDSVGKTTRKGGYIRPSDWLIEAHRMQVTSRQGFLSQIKDKTSQFGYGHLYNNLAPEVFCAEKIKVGTTDDGGKWMCSPQNVPEDCVIFALGISAAITFEVDIQRFSDQRCRVISVDSGQQPQSVIDALAKVRGVVVKTFVSNVDQEGKMTMDTILKKNDASSVEILKIDIEGSEFQAMEPFLEKYTPAQIMIEVHGEPQQAYDFLKMMSRKGYLLFNYEINGVYHTLCEYAFIHEDHLERYGATLLAKYL